VRFVVCGSNQKASPHLRSLDLARLASARIYFHWSTLLLCQFIRGILSEVAKAFDFRCESCDVFFCKKIAIEEMLHGGALLCNISSWCCGVIDCDYLSGCDVYSIDDVVLNFYLCVIAPLGSTFMLLRLAFVQFSFDDLTVTCALV
jgi:hypothetical protein